MSESPHFRPATRLFQQRTRTVVGLMSGTSLDGVDAALARLTGTGADLQFEVLALAHQPYPAALRAALLANSAPETSDVYTLSQLNVRLAHAYADAVRAVAEAAHLPLDAIDVIGSHGQTVHHVPESDACAGLDVTSTLQIGSPSVLANLLGLPVVGDFRLADMALGGQGAPLVPYFDYITFAHPTEARALLNLGGIANLTVLPAGCSAADVYAFDTGPANMIIDLLTQHATGQPYDEGGRLAAQGTVRDDLLRRWLADPYFAQPPPKSTGREHFGADWVAREAEPLAKAGVPLVDLIATATAFTAHSIHDAYQRFIAPTHPLDVVIPSGGGRNNPVLMQMLADAFAPVRVQPIDAYGVDADAKEALCFAILAHEYLNGTPTNLPSVTGASRPALLGTLCMV